MTNAELLLKITFEQTYGRIVCGSVDRHWSQQFAFMMSWPVDRSLANTQEHSDPITWCQKQYLGLKAI